ncbi:MAG: diaminopimelate epimerase [Leptonema sp. (in: Bacteria)]|nr:diaminopimelate epimerase [Leptonema sp. (in: bacteria)]
MNLKITKMNGTGNSFILIDNRDFIITDGSSLAKDLCNVNFGIGADGMILVEPSKEFDIRMRIFNSDGSEPEMCGNGIRCFTYFLNRLGVQPIQNETYNIETLAGLIKTRIVSIENATAQVEVDMGRPVFQSIDFADPAVSNSFETFSQIQLDNRNYILISMGNPHAVTFVEDYNFPYVQLGASIQKNEALFPNGINVEFVKIMKGSGELEMRVWERGCGETLACGTGACASVVAATVRSLLKRGKTIKVHLKGGSLNIRWQKNDHVIMQGPAQYVFDGVYSMRYEYV